MKTNKLIAIMFFAVLVAGCSKDNNEEGSVVPNDGLLHITAEAINSNAKVLVNPAEPNGASWVAGEQIDLNGTPCTIARRNDYFYLDGIAPQAVDMYAIYPATINANGNDIAVTNNGSTTCAIDIHSYAIDIHPDGSHDVIFPMAAYTAAGGTSLLFRHLTGALRLTLTGSTTHHVTRLVVTATREDGSAAIYKDLKPSWANGTLPGIPGGEPGSVINDQGAQFISDMTLVMNTNDGNGHLTQGVDIEAGNSLTFCIPLLVKELKRFAITGYNGDSQLFSKTKTLDNALDVERNKMYNIPEIAID